jgi:hypothetical protein
MKKPKCRICGAEVAPGTLLTHERTHPAPEAIAAKPVYCRRPICIELAMGAKRVEHLAGTCR